MIRLPTEGTPDLVSGTPRWDNIGGHSDSAYYVDYLDRASAQHEIKRYKQRSYELMGARQGAHVLDVGCGTGDDVLTLAQIVAPTGRAVGIDTSSMLIDEARRRAGKARAPIALHVADACALPFADCTLDASRADRLLMHLPQPQRAIDEMCRVTKPGGRVLVREPDWGTFVVDHPDAELSQQLMQWHFHRAMPSPLIGRQLYAALQQAGLECTAVADTSTLVLNEFGSADRFYGFSDAATAYAEAFPYRADAIGHWLHELKRLDAHGRFFCAVTGFTVVGTKRE